MSDRIEISGTYKDFKYYLEAIPLSSAFGSALIPVITTSKYRVHALVITQNNYTLADYNTWSRWIVKPKNKEDKSAYRRIEKVILKRLESLDDGERKWLTT